MQIHPELADEYLKEAMEFLDTPMSELLVLLALRTIAEAYGGLGAVASKYGLIMGRFFALFHPKVT